jgi:hypothetical protein
MKIFLSWAGSVSQAVAVTLRKHLPLMVQSLDVFMSKHDIGSGARWGQELSSQVDTTSFGVFCLTPVNYHKFACGQKTVRCVNMA